ncbi:hypothetical protein [Actinoplanes auranticolor]|uniref:Uncharacterized protein n=1 Tax=Actinoplanes auranticolor TaxID=47988 RepID=A0A919SKN0_9ACTN|nr:hypothetical protein [Actinoplanes auranticolor]GIM74520.1 hypothetical protein Aau02nite_61400 [Actinoplanes auranticolor]
MTSSWTVYRDSAGDSVETDIKLMPPYDLGTLLELLDRLKNGGVLSGESRAHPGALCELRVAGRYPVSAVYFAPDHRSAVLLAVGFNRSARDDAVYRTAVRRLRNYLLELDSNGLPAVRDRAEEPVIAPRDADFGFPASPTLLGYPVTHQVLLRFADVDDGTRYVEVVKPGSGVVALAFTSDDVDALFEFLPLLLPERHPEHTRFTDHPDDRPE